MDIRDFQTAENLFNQSYKRGEDPTVQNVLFGQHSPGSFTLKGSPNFFLLRKICKLHRNHFNISDTGDGKKFQLFFID